MITPVASRTIIHMSFMQKVYIFYKSTISDMLTNFTFPYVEPAKSSSDMIWMFLSPAKSRMS